MLDISYFRQNFALENRCFYHGSQKWYFQPWHAFLCLGYVSSPCTCTSKATLTERLLFTSQDA